MIPAAIPDPEETAILKRLGSHRTIYVVRPEGQAAVERLAKRGLVIWDWEIGGVWDSVMAVRIRAGGRPFDPAPGGGRVA